MKKYILSLLHNKPALFDWSVIIFSTLLGLFFPTLGDFAGTPGFSFWMLAALLLYILGTVLKDLPLSRRLSSPGTPPRQVPFILFLLIGHWIIMMVVVILCEKAFRSLTGMAPLPPDYNANGTTVFIVIVAASVITWLVYRTKSNRKNRKEYDNNFLFRLEMLADILLFLSVSVFTFLFWEKGVMAMLGRSPARTVGDVWFLFIFLSILFVLIYLPLRYLYFIEDRGSSYRRRLLSIFGFLLLRVLFELISL